MEVNIISQLTPTLGAATESDNGAAVSKSAKYFGRDDQIVVCDEVRTLLWYFEVLRVFKNRFECANVGPCQI